MAQVPVTTRFIGIADSVDLTERKSAQINAETEPYTMQDILDTVPAGAQGPQGPVGQTGAQGIQGVDGAVGPAGLNWQGAFVGGTSYVLDDAVSFGGASWFCINPTSSVVTPDINTTDWALLASQGAVGPQGIQGVPGVSLAPVWGGITGTLSNQTDLQSELNGKQDDLVSGTNIKTINGDSVLVSGDLGLVESIVPGSNIFVDTTDPANPIVHANPSNPMVVGLKVTDGTAVTGTLAATISQTILIPAYTFNATGGMLEFVARYHKTGQSGNHTCGVMLSTSPTGGGTTIALFTLNGGSGGGSNLVVQGIRTARISSNTLTVYPATTSNLTDYAGMPNTTPVAFDPTVNNYLLFTIALSDINDSSVVEMARATKYV